MAGKDQIGNVTPQMAKISESSSVQKDTCCKGKRKTDTFWISMTSVVLYVLNLFCFIYYAAFPEMRTDTVHMLVLMLSVASPLAMLLAYACDALRHRSVEHIFYCVLLVLLLIMDLSCLLYGMGIWPQWLGWTFVCVDAGIILALGIRGSRAAVSEGTARALRAWSLGRTARERFLLSQCVFVLFAMLLFAINSH